MSLPKQMLSRHLQKEALVPARVRDVHAYNLMLAIISVYTLNPTLNLSPPPMRLNSSSLISRMARAQTTTPASEKYYIII